ncbi:hypothetical protein, partial [Micromonospora luteifusca]|uniref:hypothetical protein n=1 Tax=Micromonospora luteifusca TaxID=709860 RepID=UPI0033AE40CC
QRRQHRGSLRGKGYGGNDGRAYDAGFTSGGRRAAGGGDCARRAARTVPCALRPGAWRPGGLAA